MDPDVAAPLAEPGNDDTELTCTAKQGLTTTLGVSYSVAKEREFHVVSKAPLDPKQVTKNYKVLTKCINDVRGFVVEAELRLHRKPTHPNTTAPVRKYDTMRFKKRRKSLPGFSANDNTTGSLARFKKLQKQHEKKDVDLGKLLEDVSYSWKGKKKRADPVAAAPKLSTPIRDGNMKAMQQKLMAESASGGSLPAHSAHPSAQASVSTTPSTGVSSTPAGSRPPSGGGGGGGNNEAARRRMVGGGVMVGGPQVETQAEKQAEKQDTELSSGFVEATTRRRFYEVRGGEKLAYPTVAVVHAQRSLERERARVAHQAAYLEAHDPAAKFRAKSKAVRRKLVPHEGRGVSPMWAGSNPPSLGPGKYKVRGGGRRAGEIAIENSLSLSPLKASSFFLDATGRAYPPLLGSSSDAGAPPRISMRSQIMSRMEERQKGGSSIDNGGDAFLSVGDVPTNQRGSTGILRSGGSRRGGLLDVDADENRTVGTAEGQRSVWSLQSGDSTIGKDGPMTQHVRPLTGSKIGFRNDGRPRIATGKKETLDKLLDQKVFRAAITDYTFGALSYVPPREQYPPATPIGFDASTNDDDASSLGDGSTHQLSSRPRALSPHLQLATPTGKSIASQQTPTRASSPSRAMSPPRNVSSPGRQAKSYPGGPPLTPDAFKGQRRSRAMSPPPQERDRQQERSGADVDRGDESVVGSTIVSGGAGKRGGVEEDGALSLFAEGSLPFPNLVLDDTNDRPLGQTTGQLPSRATRIQPGFRPRTTGGAAMEFFGDSVVDVETGTVLGKSQSVGDFLRQWKIDNDIYTPAKGPRTISRATKRRSKVWEVQ